MLHVLQVLHVFGLLHVLHELGWLQLPHELQAVSVSANVATANSERRRRIDASWFENEHVGNRTERPSSLRLHCTDAMARTHVSVGDVCSAERPDRRGPCRPLLRATAR